MRLPKYSFTPYVNAEATYTITSDRWTGATYEFGAEFPTFFDVSLQPYVGVQYAWQGTSTVRSRGIGLILIATF